MGLNKTVGKAAYSAVVSAVVGALLVCSGSALADDFMGGPGSRILATSGATSIEGGAGGGIVPWAMIAGYGSDTEIGGSAFYTRVSVDEYDLETKGFALGFYNRLEVSYARQTLDVNPLGLEIEQDIIGLKYRVAGDLIYNNLPQITVGLQYKENKDFLVPGLLGAEDDSGIDYLVSASKLYLGALGGHNLLLNATLRHTEANQTGLLGFGAANGGDVSINFEGSAAVLLNSHWAVGYEYKQKPDELGLGEENWQDVFVGWFPNKRFSVVVAYADLGSVAGFDDQTGWYASFQLTH